MAARNDDPTLMQLDRCELKMTVASGELMIVYAWASATAILDHVREIGKLYTLTNLKCMPNDGPDYREGAFPFRLYVRPGCHAFEGSPLHGKKS